MRYSQDKLTYRFLLRPEARFSDGSPLRAVDVAFSLTTLKEKAHPDFSRLLTEVESVEAEADDVVKVRFVKNRTRDAHLIVAGMPVFSAAWWKGRDFDAATLEAPLGSGAYKVKKFEQSRFIEFELDPNYWAKDLPLNIGGANFQRLRYEYFRERQVAFEAFKAGVVNFNEEHTSRFWATSYDFVAVKEGRIVKESLHNGAPTGSQGWYFNTRREQFKDPRVREAIGLAFDFEWTNQNVMYSSYKRVVSFFQNTPLQAVGQPGPGELALLEPLRGEVPGFRVRRALHSAHFGRVGKRSGAVEARQRNAARSGLPARRRHFETAERQSFHDRVSRFLAGAATAHDAVRAESGETRDRGGFADRRRVTI